MIVVPCYNEEEILPYSIEKLTGVIQNLIEKSKISSDSGILLVNDGSRDCTWEIIEREYKNNQYVYGVKLAANVGHQNALMAGIRVASEICDVSISIDADLQDDIEVIEKMVDKYLEGIDIVYGVRSERKTDSFFKRFTAQSFYKLMKMLGVQTGDSAAGCRLMSLRAMKQLEEYKERNLFLRGMVPLIGYKTATVSYARKKRLAGESKYPLKKMLSFAWDGITSFSIKPISMIMTLGGIIVLCSVAAFIYTFVSYFMGHVSPGWSSLMISIWFLGGIQILAIGVVGEYVGKTYIESKERPRYNIEEFLNHEK